MATKAVEKKDLEDRTNIVTYTIAGPQGKAAIVVDRMIGGLYEVSTPYDRQTKGNYARAIQWAASQARLIVDERKLG